VSITNTVFDVIKRHFVGGVLVVVPLILTYLVLRYLFVAVDDILGPIILRLFGYYIPGLGVITTLLLIILAGFFTRGIIGARVYRMWDRMLRRMPLIRPIYSSAKRMLEAVTNANSGTFKEVVLVEYPRKGLWALGFISRYFEASLDGTSRGYCTVFMGSSPTPITGWVIVVPQDEVLRLEMTVEEGFKLLVSGGVVSPEEFKLKAAIERSVTGEVAR
jgi:uncharacterized membrane protein